MVSPISALSSSTPGVRALTRVSAVAAKSDAVDTTADAAPAATPPPPSPGPGARDAHLAGYRNLALPIGAQRLSAQAMATDGRLVSAYGPSETALAGLPRLVGDRLPTQTIVREARAAARAVAGARGETAAEFLDSAPVVAGPKLPSRNPADAEATLRTALLARAGERETATLDIYLAKIGPSSFEAVTFDRDFAAPGGGFPYAAPPLSVDRILLDPTCEAIVSVMAGAPGRRWAETQPTGRMPMALLVTASAVAAATLVAAAVLLGMNQPTAAAAIGGGGIGALVYLLRGARA